MSDVADSPEVSLCIPAWQSEPFIARTLDCALAQSYPHTRILVSVDQSDDGTAEICHAYARTDRRIEVFVQSERLGWARNVNFLLDRVGTEFYCLYFHDDLIEPGYVERLLSALRRRPDAVSAHCDMGHFGASEHVSQGVDYPESAVHRMAWFLVAPNRGSPMRSLTRSLVLHNGLRMPTDAVDGLWASEPFLMGLLAAGPALHVPETLYLRWDKRSGGLTDGWQRLTLEQQVSGFRANISTLLSLVDSVSGSDVERAALRFCLYVHYVPRIRWLESQYASASPMPAGEIHPLFAVKPLPDELAVLGMPAREWAMQRYAGLESEA